MQNIFNKMLNISALEMSFNEVKVISKIPYGIIYPLLNGHKKAYA